jgi:hypothetical protein
MNEAGWVKELCPTKDISAKNLSLQQIGEANLGSLTMLVRTLSDIWDIARYWSHNPSSTPSSSRRYPPSRSPCAFSAR